MAERRMNLEERTVMIGLKERVDDRAEEITLLYINLELLKEELSDAMEGSAMFRDNDTVRRIKRSIKFTRMTIEVMENGHKAREDALSHFLIERNELRDAAPMKLVHNVTPKPGK
jgi:hypothetical protein